MSHSSGDVTPSLRHPATSDWSEAHCHTVLESIPLGVALVTPDLEVIAANQCLRKWFPRTDPQGAAACYLCKDPPKDAPCPGCPAVATFADGLVHEHIEEMVIDGRPSTLRVISAPVRDAGGKIVAASVILEDVTSQMADTETLRRLDAEKQLILSTMDAILIVLDGEGRVVVWNPAAAKVFGVAAEGTVGKRLAECGLSWDYERLCPLLRDSRETGASRRIEDLRFTRPSGEGGGLGLTIAPMSDGAGAAAGTLMIGRDVTERNVAEKVLQESERWHRNLLDAAPDMLWEVDLEGNFVYASPQTRKIFGYAPEELLGKSLFHLVPPDALERTGAQFYGQMQAGAPLYTVETDGLRKDGGRIVIEVRSVPCHDGAGNVTGFQGVTRDVTERRQAQEAQERIARRQVRLSALQQELLGPAPLDEKLKKITDVVVEIFDADLSRIWLTRKADRCESGCVHAKVTEGPDVCRHRDRCLHLKASSGRYTHLDGDVHCRVPFGYHRLGPKAGRTETKFLTNDATHDPRVRDHQWAADLGLVSFAGYHLRPPEGDVLGVMALFSRHPISAEDDALLEIIGHTASQVVRQAEVEAALRAKQEQNRAVLLTAMDGFWLADTQGRLLEVNDAYCRMSGYSERELRSMRIQDLEGSETPEDASAHFQKIMARGEDRFESRHRRKDGTVFDVEVSVQYRPTEGGRFVVFLRDISARKLAEAALRESEERYRSLVEHMDLGVTLISKDFRVIMTNPAQGRLFDRTPESFVGKECFREFEGRDQRCPHCPGVVAIRTGKPAMVETVGKRVDGTAVPVMVRAFPIFEPNGEPKGFIEVVEDISARKQAEAALRKSEAQYRVLVENIGIGVNLIGKDHTVLMTNSATNRMAHKTSAEMVGRKCFREIGGLGKPCSHCPGSRAMATKLPTETETEVTQDDGSRQVLRIRAFPFFEPDGEAGGFIEVVEDVTERRRSDERLKESQKRFQDLALISGDYIWEVDTQGKYTLALGNVESILGYKPEELIGKTVFDLMPEDEARRMLEPFTRIAAEKKPIVDMENWNVTKDGRRVLLLTNAVPMLDGAGNLLGYRGMDRDITGRKNMEQQLLEAQKLDAIGRLASGIAHEINTPTQYIGDNVRFLHETLPGLVGLIEKVKARLADGGLAPEARSELLEAFRAADTDYLAVQVPKAIEQSLEGIRHVSRIVGAMKDFSHPPTTRKTLVAVNHALDTTIAISRNEWKYVADVVTNFEPSLPAVPGLPAELNQVFLNILVNAAHAIEDAVGKDSGRKGTITVATRSEDGWVEVRVSDTGTGIPRGVRGKVFEPFFTTKEIGRGTGQGLPIARSVVVEKHGGTLTFETEEGKGTTFIIRLPRAEPAPSKEKK